MAKPLIGLLTVATIAFAWEWYCARGEADQLAAHVEALKARPREAVSCTGTVAGMTEEQQAAYILAQLAGAGATNSAGGGREDLEAEIDMLRRRLERAENARRHAEKARSASCNERQALLHERQAFVNEITRLQELAAGLAGELLEYKQREERRRR